MTDRRTLAGLDALAARDLASFARANGWTYRARGVLPSSTVDEQLYTGVVVDSIGGDGWETGHITAGTRTAEVTLPFGSSTITSRALYRNGFDRPNLGYVAVTLPRRVPHIILDSIHNDDGPKSSLRRRPRRRQRFRLGGECERHFRVYVPKGYEADAMYLLSPALLAEVIDHLGTLDLEFRDNCLLIYRPGGWDRHDPNLYAWIAWLQWWVNTKVAWQVRHYHDANIARSVDRARPGGLIHRDGVRLAGTQGTPLWVKGVGVLLAATLVVSLITRLVEGQ